MTKFRVGQVWKVRYFPGEWKVSRIINVDKVALHRIDPSNILENASDELMHPADLITLIKDTEETVSKETISVSDETKSAVVTQYNIDFGVWPTGKPISKLSPEPSGLPAEPTAGQYYRTRDGRKFKFLTKGTHSYIYEHFEEEGPAYIFVFEQPYEQQVYGQLGSDIIAPWTDPPVRKTLPSLEIKRWAIVAKMDVTDNDGDLLKRGEYIFEYDSEDDAKNHLIGWSNKDWYEIVELTGTLPAEEIT